MGVIKKGILGGFSGKIGQVVGGTWKGINYMRSLPASVANPRTSGQVNQRSKFKGATQFFSILLGSIVQPFWNGKKPQMSGYNDIVQKNVENFDISGAPIYPNLIISDGPLLNVDNIVIGAVGATETVTTSWTDNSGSGNAVSNDWVNIVVFNTSRNTKFTRTLNSDRQSTLDIFGFPGIQAGDALEVYVFTSRDGNNLFQSPSYHTNIVVA